MPTAATQLTQHLCLSPLLLGSLLSSARSLGRELGISEHLERGVTVPALHIQVKAVLNTRQGDGKTLPAVPPVKTPSLCSIF